MPVVRIRVQKADGHGLDLTLLQLFDGCPDIILVEACEGRSIGSDTLANFEAKWWRNQGPSTCPVRVELTTRVPPAIADLESVSKSFGRDERGVSFTSLDHGVGDDRRAVHEPTHPS